MIIVSWCFLVSCILVIVKYMKEVLKKHFGYDEFRPLQADIISDVLAGKDTFVLMPTGGGKSLCFQLPALMLPGLTLVISPLIALMKDQVDSLRANGIAAAYINSSLAEYEISEICEQIRDGKVKLIYIAPERFALTHFRDFLSQLEISLVAVDEAHCISEWGHDFRPDYRHLRTLKEFLPQTPLIALTATATPRVRDDIVNLLKITKAKTFISSFDRPNLNIEVKPKKDSLRQLLGILNEHKGQSTIIYCHSRKETDELAENLRLNGFNAIAYHAGLDAHKRQSVQELFIRDKADIICATIAFGMGIDKPDVRLVIHHSFPKTLESYYQEIGRAGRDGLPSRCILFYSYADTRKHEFFIGQMIDKRQAEIARNKLASMLEYCEANSCRKKILLRYLGEEQKNEKCGACDACLDPRQEIDATEIAQKIMSAILRCGSRFGRKHIIDVLRGSESQRIMQYGHDRLSVYGLLKHLSADYVGDIIRQLVERGLIKKSEDEYPVLGLSPAGIDALNRRTTIMLFEPKKKELSAKKAKALISLEYDQELFRLLRVLRREIADTLGVPPFVIFGDKSLMEMAYYLPQDKEAFLRINGVGQKKLEDFGERFMAVIREYAQENSLTPREFPTLAEGPEPILRAEKPKFNQKTKELVMKKIPIERIAKHQGLTPGTIINHIEKLVDAGEILDLDYLKLPQDRFEVMSRAFDEVGAEYLKPVFDHLEEKYSYDELRLARILWRIG